MNNLTDVTKKIILAGLGSMDEQNEEVKDLLKKGSAILGMGQVDNEELLYNGNRDEIMARRLEKEREENAVDLGYGRKLYLNSSKDEEGKVERSIEFEKKPVNVEKDVKFAAQVSKDGTETVSLKTIKNEKEASEGGKNNDQN